jgi:Cu(I)/Ag(I) efflux system membrane protein CusA/SilA
MKVVQAIRDSNRDVGGRVVEMAETEYMVRGRGYLRGKADIEGLVVKAERGTPVLVRDIARVELGPDERRGIAELNGEGEVVSGIATARYGQNALEVIRNVKEKLAEIAPGLPAGVSIATVYDRSELIERAIATLKTTLIEESIIVALVCLVFLMHVRSALVAIIMLPVGVLIAFIAMRALGMNSNIMSLGGVAIAIGAMVDAAIVMIENAHKHIERIKEDHSNAERAEAIIAACREVGPALFFSLLIITVSFLPVFTLEAQEGRLFSPLAYTKTFAMAGAAMLSVTLVPVLMLYFIRGRIIPEAKNPVNRVLIWLYRPIICRRDALQGQHHRPRPCRHGGNRVPGLAPRQRVHAHAQRGHAVLYAHLAAGHVHHQGRRTAADPGQDHKELSRGGLGDRQGRPRQHRDRPGADRNV